MIDTRSRSHTTTGAGSGNMAEAGVVAALLLGATGAMGPPRRHKVPVEAPKRKTNKPSGRSQLAKTSRKRNRKG